MRQKLLQIPVGWLITNCEKILLQVGTADLLQIATNLLQIAIGITNCDRTLTSVILILKGATCIQIPYTN